MSEFATTLRTAREAKGLTISQVSEATHILSAVIDGLEHDDFSRIPAPIYGRGFVRLYCEAVGISDPRPLVDAFMRLYNNTPEPPTPLAAPPAPPAEQPATSCEPATSEPPATPEPPAPVTPEPPASPTPNIFSTPLMPNDAPIQQAATESDFRLEAESIPQPVSFDAPPATPERPAAGANVLSGEPTRLSRYASPLHEFTRPNIPPAVWRMTILGILAIGLLYLLWIGVSTLYRATSPKDTDRPTPAAPATEQPAVKTPTPTPKTAPAPKPAPASKATPTQKAAPAPKTAPTTRRAPQKIESLYMD